MRKGGMRMRFFGKISGSGRQAQRGFSLLEILFSAVIFSLAAMTIVRLLGTASVSSVQIHKDERRASLLDYIEGRFKSVDYFDVFGVDSSLPTGTLPFTGTFGVPNSFWNSSPQYKNFHNNYGGARGGLIWTNWNTSRMRQVILDIDQKVRDEGYSRWVVRMTMARRVLVLDASTATNVTMANQAFFTDGNNDGIDDTYTEFYFKDVDGDRLFFSTFTDAQGYIRSEIPNMPQKEMEILLYKGSNIVNRRSNFILMPGGLSGNEMGIPIADLWATMTLPNKNLFQDTSSTHISLRLGLTPGTGFFKKTTFPRLVVNPIQVDMPDGSLDPANPGHRLAVNVKTTPGASVFCKADGDQATTVSALVGVTGLGTLPLDSDLFTQKLMGEATHEVTCYVERSGARSPSLRWTVNTDRTAPIATTLQPLPGSIVRTRTPNVYAVLKDTSPLATGGRWGVEMNSVSMGITQTGDPGSSGEISYKPFRLPVLEMTNASNNIRSSAWLNTNGLTAVFADTTTLWLPYIFEDGSNVNMRVEFADGAPHKTAVQWSFTVDLPDVDVSSPTVTPISPLPGAVSVSALSPIQFRVSDPDSGANPYSLELVVTNGMTQSIVLNAASGSLLGKSLSGFVDPTGAANTGSFVVTSTHTVPFPPGVNTVTVRVRDWKDNPNDTADPSCTYTFTVP